MKACQDAQAEAAKNSSSTNSASESKEEDEDDSKKEEGVSEEGSEGGEGAKEGRRLQINEWSRNPDLNRSLADRIRLELDIDEDYIDEDIAE